MAGDGGAQQRGGVSAVVHLWRRRAHSRDEEGGRKLYQRFPQVLLKPVAAVSYAETHPSQRSAVAGQAPSSGGALHGLGLAWGVAARPESGDPGPAAARPMAAAQRRTRPAMGGGAERISGPTRRGGRRLARRLFGLLICVVCWKGKVLGP
jgi:hypothetical protein